LLLPVLLVVPGAVMLRTLFPDGRPPGTDSAERVFLAVLSSVLLTGLLGFLLAELGWFSVWLIAGLELVIVAGLWRWNTGDWNLGPRSWLGLGRFIAASVRPLGARLLRFRPEIVLLCGLLLLGAALFARPAEMVRGALDSGAYVNAGVALGRTGSILIRDRLMRELNNDLPGGNSELREVLQEYNRDRFTLRYNRMPGFFVLDKQDAAIVPQHYSFFPVWIGIFYQLFGLWGALYATPILALLSVAAIYFFTRRIFTPSVALLALALLVLCPVQIWFARYPVSEVPTQLLAFVFFYAFATFLMGLSRLRSLERTGAETLVSAAGEEAARLGTAVRLFGVIAGVALGELVLTRPDFPFYLAAVAFYLLVWRLTRTWRAEHWWFVVPLGLLLGVWVVHFLFFSYPYTLDLYHNKLQDWRRDWQKLLALLYIGGLLLFALDRLHDRLRPLAATLGGWLNRRRNWWVAALCVAVALYLGWQYGVAPWVQTARLIAAESGHIPFTFQSYIGAPVDPEVGANLVRVGWYLSPLGIILGGLGLLRALWKRLSLASGAFFITLAVVSVIFADETYTVPTYIYSARRYLTVLIPALLIFAAYFLAWVGEKWRPRLPARIGGWAAYGALLVFFIYTSRVIIPHVEERGAVAQMEDLVRRFPNPAKTVVLFSNERDEPYLIATPLQMIWGFTAFSLNQSFGRDLHSDIVQGMIQRWQKQGYDVYMMMGANGGKLNMPDLTVQPIADPQWTWNVPELEQLTTQKPSNTFPSVLPFGIYTVVSRTQTTPPGWPFSVDIGTMDYAYTVGGFYSQEQDPGDPTPWRWTHGSAASGGGLGPAALLRLPWAGTAGQSARLTLRLRAGPPARTSAAEVQVFVADPATGNAVGPAVGTARVMPGAPFQDFAFPLPPQPGPDVLIRLEVPPWSDRPPSQANDPRVLGVQLDSAEIEAAP
jgi:hypothetical protein